MLMDLCAKSTEVALDLQGRGWKVSLYLGGYGISLAR